MPKVRFGVDLEKTKYEKLSIMSEEEIIKRLKTKHDFLREMSDQDAYNTVKKSLLVYKVRNRTGAQYVISKEEIDAYKSPELKAVNAKKIDTALQTIVADYEKDQIMKESEKSVQQATDFKKLFSKKANQENKEEDAKLDNEVNNLQKEVDKESKLEVEERKRLEEFQQKKQDISVKTNGILDKLSNKSLSTFRKQMMEIGDIVRNAKDTDANADKYLNEITEDLTKFEKELDDNNLGNLERGSQSLAEKTETYKKTLIDPEWNVLDKKELEEQPFSLKKEKYKVKVDNVLEDIKPEELNNDVFEGRPAIHEEPKPQKTIWKKSTDFLRKHHILPQKKKTAVQEPEKRNDQNLDKDENIDKKNVDNNEKDNRQDKEKENINQLSENLQGEVKEIEDPVPVVNGNIVELNANAKQEQQINQAVDPKVEDDLASEYEDELNKNLAVMQTIKDGNILRGSATLSDLEQDELNVNHTALQKKEADLGKFVPAKTDMLSISVPDLVKNQMKLDAGQMSREERKQHYMNIIRMKDVDGDKYSKQLMDYRMKVAEAAGREFEKKHQDPTKLSFLNKSANAIEKVMCAMTRNPLGIGVLLVAAINAPALMLGLLVFTLWKRKRPNPEYQNAWQEQQQRELAAKRQELATLFDRDPKTISDREVTNALRADYVNQKVLDAMDAKMGRDAQKVVDSAAKDYAKSISKESGTKYTTKDLKNKAQKEIMREKYGDNAATLSTQREKNLQQAINRHESKKGMGGIGM